MRSKLPKEPCLVRCTKCNHYGTKGGLASWLGTASGVKVRTSVKYGCSSVAYKDKPLKLMMHVASSIIISSSQRPTAHFM